MSAAMDVGRVAAAGLAAALAGAALTGVVRRFAIARAVLDVPNERSSHTLPTPRGGGLAVIAVAGLGLVVAALLGAVDASLAVALVGGGAPVAAIGWQDDRRGVRPLVRFAVHLCAAVWVVAWLGGMPALRVGAGAVPLGPLGALLAVVGIVWAINLFNFMDGIDGIAGIEAVSVAGIGAALGVALGRPGDAIAAAVVAGASAGFLRWNWAPARIFLGDVGSGTLGLAIGALALRGENAGGPPMLAWVILFAVFVVDATATLLRRVARGEKWYSAHRSHAYQRVSRALGAHAPVSATCGGLNVLLGLLAAAACARPALLPVALGAALALTVGAYLLVERLNPMFAPTPSPTSPRPRGVER